METQTEPNSESLAGYPTSASGGLPVLGMPSGIRTGARQEVPDAITNPVAPTTVAAPVGAARFGVPKVEKESSGIPIIVWLFGLLFLAGLLTLIIYTSTR